MEFCGRVAILSFLIILALASLYFLQNTLPSFDEILFLSPILTNELSCQFEDRWIADGELVSVGNSSSPFLVLPPIKDIKYLREMNSESKMILLALASSTSFRFFELREGKEMPISRDSISTNYFDVTKRFCSRTSSRKLKDLSSASMPISSINSIKIHIDSLTPTATTSPPLATPSLFYQREGRSFNGILHEEEYRLEIHYGSIVICVATPIALQHALSTLSQLLDSPSPIPLPVLLHDWPENRWRGLLVDVARHFMPLSLLKRTVDGMAAVKFNTLHLHLTDSQSFPVMLEDLHPDLCLSCLAERGSFSSSRSRSQFFDGANKTYSPADLRDLVRYAESRGVQIVPEIDVPSHSLSWGKSYPELVVHCPVYASRQQTPGDVFALHPLHPQTLVLIEAILTQIADIFPSPYLHTGGDEVMTECWLEDPVLSKEINSRGVTVNQVFGQFESKVFDIIRKLGKIPMSWQGLIDQDVLPPELQNTTSASSPTPPPLAPSIVETWKCWSSLAERASTKSLLAGHPVIASACWYLDYSSDVDEYLKANPVEAAISAALRATATHSPSRSPTSRPTNQPSPPPVAAAVPVPPVFNSSSGSSRRYLQISKPPLSSRLPSLEGVRGGEAAMWTERVDFTNFECRVWPRAILMASSLWGHIDSFALFDSSASQTHESLNLTQSQQEERTKREDSYRGRSFLLSYVRIRFYFVHRLKISASAITIHRRQEMTPSPSRSSSSSKVYSTPEYAPLPLRSERDLLLTLQSTSSISLSSDGRRFQSGDVRLRSQCPMIPQHIQRPVEMKEKRIMQINLENGAPPPREALLEQWLVSKANEGVLFIGLCELNGWHRLESTTDLTKNFPLISSKGARAGFVYSHLLHSSLHPFHLGILSALPFEVRAQLGPPLFQRGVLHVYFPSLRLHAFVCHLHAHNSSAREQETRYLMANHVSPLLAPRREGKGEGEGEGQGERVVLMGDLNSLYEGDKTVHEEERLVELFQRRDHTVFQRLQQKFCTPSGTEINYRPLSHLVGTAEQSGGLVETCIEHCRLGSLSSSSTLLAFESLLSLLSGRDGGGGGGGSKWLSWMRSENATSFQQCVHSYCSATEPTLRNPEWPALKGLETMPRMRLDFIFASPALLLSGDGDGEGKGKGKGRREGERKRETRLVAAGIERSNVTDDLSDHYPVYLSWLDSLDPFADSEP